MAGAKLLTNASNYAVVQLPERAFPGVVVQGDSLNGLIAELEEALRVPEEREAILAELIERLCAVQARYEAVLAEHGLKRPY